MSTIPEASSSDRSESSPSRHEIPAETVTGAPKRRLWIWFVWLGAFYTTWLAILITGDRWQALREHWPMALAMTFGSYVAGSTPMGGGFLGLSHWGKVRRRA